jgi:outer membrane receptor protein involved in Fe transport
MSALLCIWAAGIVLGHAAEIRLTVRDPSGAPMSAAVTVESVRTGVARTTAADAGGSATLADLAPGLYRIRVSREGFAPVTILVRAAEAPVEREVTLPLGAASFAADVVGTTPLAGLDRPAGEIPAPVRTATAADLESAAALDLSDFLNRRFAGVALNELQGNPYQADLNFRGFTASPLLGTPQGISVFLDGVRWNQPFGDAVSWDLLPRFAVSELALVPGSDPLFGLNTLGGALSLRTKDGQTAPGTSLELAGGSFARKSAEFAHGGGSRRGYHWYVASNLFFEDGWRDASPSAVRQFFGKFGAQRDRASATLAAGYANNGLIGNGLQEQRFLARDYASVYTRPDLTAHRAPHLNLQARRSFGSRFSLSGGAYFRHLRARTLNGDINEDSLDQSLYQPNAAERAALAAAGFAGFPLAGENAANTPFPFWRCIANVLRRDEPSEKCNGLLNRSSSLQRSYGVAAQLSRFGARGQWTAGGSWDGNHTGFEQSTELGYLAPSRTVVPLAAFADGVTGGEADGEPFDNRVRLASRVHTGGFYAAGSRTVGRWTFSASGRYSRTVVDNRDALRPDPGPGSLTGRHVFQRFNPAAGFTLRAAPGVSLYASYGEGSRAPTAIELGCADPETPCRLPNALAGDPPLRQVVTRTVEAGLRGGTEARFQWSAGFFRAANQDDILFLAARQTGYGYFKNFGRTLRQGAEAALQLRFGSVVAGANYTFLDATFQSAEEVNGTGNSASSGGPGFEGSIAIAPGNRMPLLASHLFKAWADVPLTRRLTVTGGVVASSGVVARGNENNRHAPDGVFYLGPGSTPAYGVANLAARYRLAARVELFLRVNNLFDERYYTAAQLGVTGFTDSGAFIARPFPAVNGQFPLRHATFFAPGAPRGAWGGLRVRF